MRIILFPRDSTHLYNPATFIISGLYVMSFTLFCSLVLYKLRKNKINRYGWRYFFVFVMLYFLFGLGQQIFFQFIFMESVYFFTNNALVSILVGSVFYYLFHPKMRFGKFHYFTFFMGLFWSFSYMFFGNILWVSISHGVLGAFFGIYLLDKDPMRSRLKIIRKTRIGLKTI
ncbi:MAG: CPBP family intramembrane metalloprotease [Nanoarchaeota archaeon]|nr:CPBP family intramembrane metalloprotease [Nanoarchaeota archaeon]